MRILAALAGLLLASSAYAQTNPPTGSVWTYMGPATGTAWQPGPGTTSVAGGVPMQSPGTFSQSVYPLMVYNPWPYAYATSQAGLCVQTGKGPTTPCPIAGNFENDPSTPSWYQIRERFGLVVGTFGITPWFVNVAGTFSGANFTPATALTTDQQSKLHRGDPLDTNDTPPCTGVVLSFTSTVITTYGWWRQGAYPTSPCTPAGTAVSLNYTKMYGSNLYTRREATDQQKNSVGMEMDVMNFSGMDNYCRGYDIDNCGGGLPGQAPADGGMDIVAFGNARAAFGLQVRGSSPTAGGSGTREAFTSGITVTSPAFTGVLVWAPMPATAGLSPISVGYESDNSDEAFKAVHRGLDITVGAAVAEAFHVETGEGTNGGLRGRMFFTGNWDYGWQANGGVGATHTQRIFSSGHNTPDSQWSYQGGTGNVDGIAALSTKQLVLGNSLVVGYTGGALPTSATTGGEIAMLKNPVAAAPGAGYAKLTFGPGTTAGTCKLLAYAGTSAVATVIADNIGTGC